jgi:malate synthase
MGGMAAQIPVKGDSKANEEAFAKVRADKEREARAGHDGTWVAHPDLVPIAAEVFDRLMPEPNQLSILRDDVHATQADLIEVHKGKRTEEGLRENIRVGVQYIEAWLRGRGAVPIYNLMEDAATAEISRAQVWQWLRDGRFTPEQVREVTDEELAKLLALPDADATGYRAARELFDQVATGDEFVEFLTLPAYELLG